MTIWAMAPLLQGLFPAKILSAWGLLQMLKSMPFASLLMLRLSYQISGLISFILLRTVNLIMDTEKKQSGAGLWLQSSMRMQSCYAYLGSALA